LWPPKPKELLRAAFTLAGRGGVRHDVHIDLGVEVFDVDGGRHDLILDGLNAGDEFNAAGGAEQVTGHRLGAGDEQAIADLRVVAKDVRLMARSSHKSPTGVEVACALMYCTSVVFSLAWRRAISMHFGSTETFGMRGGEVVGISGGAVTGQLGVNRRAALLGVLEFFDDDHASTFAHDETVAVCPRGGRHVQARHCAG
jgi:hypothetical protein